MQTEASNPIQNDLTLEKLEAAVNEIKSFKDEREWHYIKLGEKIGTIVKVPDWLWDQYKKLKMAEEIDKALRIP